MTRLSAVDAQMFWMSAKIPNDQFLLYGFDGAPADLDAALRAIRARARACPDLLLRVRDATLRYPRWVVGDVDASQFVVHESRAWPQCLEAVAGLAVDQLDTRANTWRLHVFPDVEEMPRTRRGTVAVLQMSHALGDGRRSSSLAALLFGRPGAVPPVLPLSSMGSAALPWHAYRAARAHRRLERDTAAGVVPPQADSYPVLRTNSRPEGALSIRTLIRKSAEISGPTVTVGVLAAVSTALAGHLSSLGDDPQCLGAEVPMAKPGPRRANNHFGNVAVGLYPEFDFDTRVARIAADLADRRRRAGHPAMVAGDRAFSAVPALVLRWGVSQFDPSVRSPTVTGNTVVSSVNRGEADLRFGAAPVVLTAGYPGLSPMMGLAHGVHGIGNTVAVSVHAAESAIGDIDAYVERLEAAL